MSIPANHIYDFEAIGQIEEYEKGRLPLNHAYERALGELLRKHHLTSHCILEIGAGLGYFGRHLPPSFKGEWIQLEGQQEAIVEARKLNPAGTYVHGDAGKLDFPDSSIDAVVGFNVFDLFDSSSLDSTIAESCRVLRPGGLLFSVHDLIPSITAFQDSIRAQKLPSFRISKEGKYGIGHTTYLCYVPKSRVEQFEAYEQNLPPDPNMSIKETLDRSREAFEKFGVMIPLYDFPEYFTTEMKKALGKRFSSVWQETVRGFAVSRRTSEEKRQGIRPGVFIDSTPFTFCVPTFGVSHLLNAVGLPSSLEIVKMNVIAARKSGNGRI